MSRNWTETRLFASLQGRSSDSPTIRALYHYLPPVETVLRSGVPNSPDFTLHDAEHGFRVAERMAALVGTSIARLSDAEVALLLLSAYCHDVGMTPNRALSRSIYQYVLTGEEGLVESSVAIDVQNWLDNYRPGTTLPMSAAELNSSNMKAAEDICAYYGRSKHNDWSEDWIREEYAGKGYVTLYNGWIDDLVYICRSHHEGLSQLRLDRFDAKIIGSPPQNMNLRYIAAILRLADVMEFDPERTPEVIIRAREIAPSSRIYWYKDKEIAFQLDEAKHQVIFSARTPDAETHKAVLTTANWVNDELLVCSALTQENAFKRGTVLPSTRDNYEWPWPARLTTDIKEASDSFVYIDGSFRPAPNRILELLSGTALYGRPIIAVRELLQNAIDAVRELIAYQRLTHADPAGEPVADAYSAVHSVKLCFYISDGRYWLRCEDTGSGLSKEIIENSLLVGGSGPRPETRSLERAAKAAGFEVGRTGQFGIGVLSYFMIADRLEITTRRAQLAGDPDGTGWRFSIDGLSDFGELRKDRSALPGTDIRLRLKTEILSESPEMWVKSLISYVSEVLTRTPCQVSVRDDVFGLPTRMLGPGWTSSPIEGDNRLLAALEIPEARENVLYTSESLQKFKTEREKISEYKDSARSAIRSNPSINLDLPDGRGKARIWLPYFVLSGDNSLVYMKLDGTFIEHAESGKDILYPSMHHSSSWKGFLVGASGGKGPCWSAIDYTHGMNISVNRNNFAGSENPPATTRVVKSASLDYVQAFVENNPNSKFSSLNQAVLFRYGRPINHLDREIFWKTYSHESKRRWSSLKFPVCSAIRNSFMVDAAEYPLASDNCDYQFAEAVNSDERGRHIGFASWIGGGRLLIHGGPNRYGGTACIAWENNADLIPLDRTIFSRGAVFPPDWDDVLVVATNQRIIINKNHDAVNLLSKASLYRRTPFDRDGLALAIAEIGGLRHAVIEFVIGSASSGVEFWLALRDNYRDYFNEVIDVFEGIGRKRVVFWNAGGYGDENVMWEISREGVRFTTGKRVSSDIIMVPDIDDKEWIIRDLKKNVRSY